MILQAAFAWQLLRIQQRLASAAPLVQTFTAHANPARTEHRHRVTRRYADRRSPDGCVDCGGVVVVSRIRCAVCLEANAARQRERYRQRWADSRRLLYRAAQRREAISHVA